MLASNILRHTSIYEMDYYDLTLSYQIVEQITKTINTRLKPHPSVQIGEENKESQEKVEYEENLVNVLINNVVPHFEYNIPTSVNVLKSLKKKNKIFNELLLNRIAVSIKKNLEVFYILYKKEKI
jgi:hypothetical protein